MDLENKIVLDGGFYWPDDPQDYSDKVVDYCPDCGKPIWLYQDDVYYDRIEHETVGCPHCVKDTLDGFYRSKIDGEIIGDDDRIELVSAQEVY